MHSSISISSFDLKKTIYNQNDEPVTTDNFIEALEYAAEKTAPFDDSLRADGCLPGCCRFCLL